MDRQTNRQKDRGIYIFLFIHVLTYLYMCSRASMYACDPHAFIQFVTMAVPHPPELSLSRKEATGAHPRAATESSLVEALACEHTASGRSILGG